MKFVFMRFASQRNRAEPTQAATLSRPCALECAVFPNFRVCSLAVLVEAGQAPAPPSGTLSSFLLPHAGGVYAAPSFANVRLFPCPAFGLACAYCVRICIHSLPTRQCRTRLPSARLVSGWGGGVGGSGVVLPFRSLQVSWGGGSPSEILHLLSWACPNALSVVNPLGKPIVVCVPLDPFVCSASYPRGSTPGCIGALPARACGFV